MTEKTPEELISLLSLSPHPEGGHFKETYRSLQRVVRVGEEDSRSTATAIYYLLAGKERSTWHRIQSDEMWHFYAGTPIMIYILEEGGGLGTLKLGNPLQHEGAAFQVLVPAGHWFAAARVEPDGYSLVGCTVSPGFEFAEFEIADPTVLGEHWPVHRELIASLA